MSSLIFIIGLVFSLSSFLAIVEHIVRGIRSCHENPDSPAALFEYLSKRIYISVSRISPDVAFSWFC